MVPQDLWDENGYWVGSRKVRLFVRRNRFMAGIWLVLLLGFFVTLWCDVADSRAIGLPVGAATGAAVWFVLIFGFAHGWIAEGD